VYSDRLSPPIPGWAVKNRGLREVASAPLFERRWVFFGGHQKLREVLGHCWSMKIDLFPPIILFYGDEGLYWGFVGDALT
jgi:hypothetical protein